MNLTGTVTPAGVSVSLSISEEDLALAFDVPEPDEHLFFQAFSKRYDALPMSEKVLVFSKIMYRSEQALLASKLDTSGVIEPKPMEA